MANINFIQCSFTSGEVSPQIEGRVDLVKYGNSAATLNNVFVRVFGGAYRRPGTYFAEVTKLSTSAVRLIPFQFSNTQAYVIEAGDKYFRFYKDSGILQTSTGVAVELTTPYLAVNVFELQYAQDADTMYVTHTGHPVRKLTRSSHYLWSLEQVDFTGGPWLPDNLDSSAYIKASNTAGAISLFSSSGYTFVTAGASSLSGSLLRIGTSNGYVRITGITNSGTAAATVISTLHSTSSTVFTTNWAEGAWSSKNGYPQAVSFFEQRLYFGGSKKQPQTVWGSAEQSYEDFTPGSDDSDAVNFTIADNQVNAIRWMSAGKALAVGTLGGNFLMHSDSSSGPITPSNINIKKETTYGSDLILPKRIGQATVYVQRNGLTVRELAYNFEEDAQLATDMTVLSDHITKSGIKDMDFQEAPDGILWCVLKNGKMATLTRLADQDVMAWTQHETQGSFLSVAVIPNGNEDQVWVVTQRSVNAGAIRFVEYFKPFIQPDSQSDSFYVDCGLSYNGDNNTDLVNVSFENWTGGAGIPPDSWSLYGAGATTTEEATIVKVGTYSAKLTRAVADTSLGQDFSVAKGITFWRGKEITFGCWVYATVADRARLQIADGIGSTESSFHTGDSTWQYLTVSRKIALSATVVIAYCQVATGNTSVYFDGAAVNNGYVKTVTGLSHLNSRIVSVLGDGAVYPDTLVTGGAITISLSCNVIHVGLSYTSTIKTSRLEAGSITGSTQGIIKRVYKSLIRLWRSLGCNIGNETTQDIVSFRDSSMAMSSATPLFTGDKEINFPVGWNKEAQVFITQAQPLPLNVLCLVHKVEVSQE